MRHVRSRASQDSGRMVTSAIRLWTAATFEVAKRKIPGASRFRVSTAARQARRAWSRFAADATPWSTSRSTPGLSYRPEVERPNPAGVPVLGEPHEGVGALVHTFSSAADRPAGGGLVLRAEAESASRE